MKFKTRMLSLVLALTLVFGAFGTVGYAASYSDVDSDKAYFSAVSLLSALQLLKGYDDGTFKPEGDITRAEFAAVVVRVLGQEESANSAKGATSFIDVPADHWASGYINVATTLGIINGYGDGNFGPEDKVTYEQSVKMMVCALGYEIQALSYAGNDPAAVWPGGYLAAGEQLNMLQGVNGQQGVPAKRWQVARLVFNSLEIEIMEKTTSVVGEDKYVKRGKTLLADSLKVESKSGEIMANTTESVSSNASKARNGEVIILAKGDDDEEAYKDGGISTSGMVGHSVKFYYNESNDGIKTLLYIEDKTNSSDVLTIDADNIEDYSGNLSSGMSIEYWESADRDTKTKTINIDRNPTVMLNGRIVEDPDEEDLIPASGSIELIDSDKSGGYDKVLVTSYETYVVKSVNATKKEVTDLYRPINDNKTIVIDEDDSSLETTIKDISGTALDFKSIGVWSVLSIKKSQGSGRNIMEVTVSKKYVQGTVTEVDNEDYISIDNKEYKLSKYFTAYVKQSDEYEAFKVDDSGKFYLDKDGKIAAFEKTATANSYYGYLRRAEYKNNKLSLEVLTQTQKDFTLLEGASRIRIDGDSMSAEAAVDKLIEKAKNDSINTDTDDTDFGEHYAPQLIRYTLSSNKVNSIQTVNGSELTVLNLGLKKDDQNGNKMKYASSSRKFERVVKSNAAGAVNSFLINSSTIVFVVSPDRTNEDGYDRLTGYSYFDGGKTYSIEAYDTTGTDIITAKAVVVYEDVNKKPTEKSPVAFITKISESSNTNNPEYNRLVTAYVLGYGINPTEEKPVETVELRAQESDVSGLEQGDVIRYTVSDNGYINTDSVEQVYDISSSEQIANIDKKSPDAIEFNIYFGYLHSASGDTFTLSAELGAEDADETFKIAAGTQRFVYNASEQNKFLKSDIDLTTREKGTELMVFTVNNVVKAVYIIDDKGI